MRLSALLLAFAFLYLPAHAQDVASVHLAPADAQYLRRLYEVKTQAEREWKRAEQRIYERYILQHAVAKSGDVIVDAPSVASVWQWGMRFTSDFEVVTPKAEPPKKMLRAIRQAPQPRTSRTGLPQVRPSSSAGAEVRKVHVSADDELRQYLYDLLEHACDGAVDCRDCQALQQVFQSMQERMFSGRIYQDVLRKAA